MALEDVSASTLDAMHFICDVLIQRLARMKIVIQAGYNADLIHFYIPSRTPSGKGVDGLRRLHSFPH